MSPIEIVVNVPTKINLNLDSIKGRFLDQFFKEVKHQLIPKDLLQHDPRDIFYFNDSKSWKKKIEDGYWRAYGWKLLREATEEEAKDQETLSEFTKLVVDKLKLVEG